MNKVANRVISQIGNQLMGQISGANILEAFNTVASGRGIYTLLAPYFVAFSEHAKQRQLSLLLPPRFETGLCATPDQAPAPKTGVFTDSHRSLKEAVFILKHKDRGRQNCLPNAIAITCDTEQRSNVMLNIRTFNPIGAYEFSDNPGIQLFYPPIIDMLNYCYEQQIARIHVLTAGPLGLAGLLISRVLKLPIDGTYQDTLPAYVRRITKDEGVDTIIRKYACWFYNQMGTIYTTSSNVARKQAKDGGRPEKIQIVERWKKTGNVRSARVSNFRKGRFGLPGLSIRWQGIEEPDSLKAAT
jgi:hypothetical protein